MDIMIKTYSLVTTTFEKEIIGVLRQINTLYKSSLEWLVLKTCRPPPPQKKKKKKKKKRRYEIEHSLLKVDKGGEAKSGRADFTSIDLECTYLQSSTPYLQCNMPSRLKSFWRLSTILQAQAHLAELHKNLLHKIYMLDRLLAHF